MLTLVMPHRPRPFQGNMSVTQQKQVLTQLAFSLSVVILFYLSMPSDRLENCLQSGRYYFSRGVEPDCPVKPWLIVIVVEEGHGKSQHELGVDSGKFPRKFQHAKVRRFFLLLDNITGYYPSRFARARLTAMQLLLLFLLQFLSFSSTAASVVVVAIWCSELRVAAWLSVSDKQLLLLL